MRAPSAPRSSLAATGRRWVNWRASAIGSSACAQPFWRWARSRPPCRRRASPTEAVAPRPARAAVVPAL